MPRINSDSNFGFASDPDGDQLAFRITGGNTGNGFAVDVRLVAEADIDAAIRVIEIFALVGE